MAEPDTPGATQQIPREGCPLVVPPLSDSERRGKKGVVRSVFRPSRPLSFPFGLHLLVVEAPFELREETFWFHLNGKPLFPGHPDRVLVYDDWLAVFDYKFGYLPVTPADGNLQLRAYLAMLSEKYPRPAYYGAIIQPRCYPPLHSVVYSPEDIVTARNEIEQIWLRAHIKDAPLHPSPESCRYCRAKLLCPALQGIPAMLNRQLKLKSPVDVLAKMTPEKRCQALDLLKVAKGYIEDFEEASKALLTQDPEAIPLWRLKPGGEARKITSSLEAYQLLSNAALIDANAYVTVAKTPIGALVSAVKNFTGTSSKEAEEAVNRVCEPVISRTPKAPSLERQ